MSRNVLFLYGDKVYSQYIAQWKLNKTYRKIVYIF